MVAQGEPHSHVPAQALLAAATLDEGANRMMADGLGDQEAGALCALGRTRTAETELRIYALKVLAFTDADLQFDPAAYGTVNPYALKVLARAVAAPAPEGEQAAAVAGRAAASAAASALRASMPAVVEAGAELLRALLNTKVGRAAAPGWPNAVGTAMQEAEARGDALSRDVRLIRREVELYADRAKARQARGEAP